MRFGQILRLGCGLAMASALAACGQGGAQAPDAYAIVILPTRTPRPKNNNLIRVSVGCEEIEDIVADFEQALSR